MIGHEPLIAMRRQGLKPDRAVIETDWGRGRERQCAAEWPANCPRSAWIFVEPTDSPRRIDLRFLVGMLVFVDGYDRDRLMAVFDACQRANAARVIAHHCRPNPDRYEHAHELLEILDTEGVLTWHA